MKKASISEAKNNFSALVARVRRGTSVLILDRGVPVARLEPVTALVQDDGRLARLVNAGLVRPAKARLVLPRDLPRPKRGGLTAVQAIIDERRDGR
jgi:prevent-host-death family protein